MIEAEHIRAALVALDTLESELYELAPPQLEMYDHVKYLRETLRSRLKKIERKALEAYIARNQPAQPEAKQETV